MLKGRVDSTSANDVMLCLSNLISAGEKAILVDLGGLLYLTSAAFRVLLVATDEAERAFTIHGSREEALAQLS